MFPVAPVIRMTGFDFGIGTSSRMAGLTWRAFEEASFETLPQASVSRSVILVDDRQLRFFVERVVHMLRVAAQNLRHLEEDVRLIKVPYEQ